jgi:hypothetical protein
MGQPRQQPATAEQQAAAAANKLRAEKLAAARAAKPEADGPAPWLGKAAFDKLPEAERRVRVDAWKQAQLLIVPK